jgi:transcriptional regulator with XRE-family HTH domain
MSSDRKPQARLAMQERRRSLGFTQESMAAELGVALTTYRAWEQGRTRPLPGFRRRLARVMRVDLADVGRWLDGSAADVAPHGVTVPSWLGTFACLEQGAARLQAYEAITVHGLLQTSEYAGVIARTFGVSEPSHLVRSRMARQRVLSRRGSRLQLSVVMDESVLLREAGDGEIMAEQLDHLATLTRWPNIDLRIIPLRPRAQFPFGNFTLLTSPDNAGPYMVCVEDHGGMNYLDRAEAIGKHARLFELLRDAALCPDGTEQLIRATLKERYT